MGNIVAIVGRPNVGKSTLFNRLTGTRQAIVNEEAGTTRDRQYGKVEWTGKEFSLIDTGGWVVNSDDVFEEEINKQVKVAIEEADVVLFITDARAGLTPHDMRIAQHLRRTGRKTILLVNKAEGLPDTAKAEFYELGFGEPHLISSAHGQGVRAVIDLALEGFPEEEDEDLDPTGRHRVKVTVALPALVWSSMTFSPSYRLL